MTTYETSGSLTTETKQADAAALELTVAATVPSDTSVSATVKQDESGSQTADSTESVSLLDGTNSYDLSSFAIADGGTYWIEFDLSTSDDSVTPSIDEVTLHIGKYLLRFSTLSGDGDVTTVRSVARSRLSTLSGDGSVVTSRSVTHPRLVSLSGDGEAAVTRTPISKSRTAILSGDGDLQNETVFRETFPSELTRDLEWDFNFDREGFESSWLHQFGSDGAGSVALYITGEFGDDKCTPTAVIDYDADGDGTVDERSLARSVPETDQVVVYPELSGGDGYYRVLLRDLRPDDILVALTFGPTHT